ncbi:MAG: IPT/TIG domain-containing protein [Planctomycetota bacterium]
MQARHLSVLIAVLTGLALASRPVHAQSPQLNGPAASLTVNGVDLPVSPIPVAIGVPSLVILQVGASGPGPYALLAGTPSPTAFNFGSVGVLGIELSTVTVVLDGFAPDSPSDLAAATGANGTGSFGYAASDPDLDIGLQALVTDPTNVYGVRLSGTSRAVTGHANETPIFFAGEDDAQFFTASVSFAGQTWPGFWISSNGVVSFGAPETAPTGDAVAMGDGTPRAALSWRDLDPRYEGRVRVVTFPGRVEVQYDDVPLFGGGPSDRVTGTIAFLANGDAEIRLDDAPDGAQLVGFGTGAALPPGATTDLSLAVPLTDGAAAPYFESLAPGASWDLSGATLTFGPDPAPGQFRLEVDEIPLTLTGFLPPIGPDWGLASLVIRGTGFEDVVSVTLGGVPVVRIDDRGREEMHVITPAGSIGSVDVVVTLMDGRTVTAPGAYSYVTPSATGGAAPLVPGGSVEVVFDHGFVFPHLGVYHDRLWVNANGTASFGGPDSRLDVSPADFLAGPPEIAVLADAWQWGPNSLAAVYMTPFFLTVAFVDVISPADGLSYTLIAKLSHHGEVTFDLPASLPGGTEIVLGLSGGGGAPGLPIDVDLFTGPSVPGEAVFETFGPAAPFDLGGLDWHLDPVVDGADSFLGTVM